MKARTENMNIKNFNLCPSNLDNFIAKLKNLDLEKTRYIANVMEKKKTRTELQNALSHAWYQELAVNLAEHDALGYKCFCKLHFGVPILRAEDEDFRTVYDSAIKGLSYEKKIDVMKYLPVTSLMTTKQLSKYLDDIKAYFEANSGYILEFPMSYFDEA